MDDLSKLTEAARAATVYGYASVDLYRILHNFALDPDAPEFKAPLGAFGHSRRLASPEDRSIVAMNVDTPYSYAWLDLRSEPTVLTVPPFEADRYVAAMLVDLLTYITGYVSPRTNGNAGGRFLIAGPGWAGEVPGGIDGVFRCDTELCLVFLRTQLFDATDMTRVAEIQDGCSVEPLSTFAGVPAPAAAPALVPIAPVDVRAEPTARFFEVLAWMLALVPVLPDDEGVRAAISAAGLDRPSDLDDEERVAAALTGIREGLADLYARIPTIRSSGELFGSRRQLGTDHVSRACGALLGILGNSADEYLGAGYPADADGQPFDGSHAYEIRFAPDGLPPVDAFWSITLYDGDRFLYANPIDRHLVGSRMLPEMVRDADGGVTVLIQHERPDPHRAPNWLPAPAGPFSLAFRTYLPGPEIRDGRWTAPPVRRVQRGSEGAAMGEDCPRQHDGEDDREIGRCRSSTDGRSTS